MLIVLPEFLNANSQNSLYGKVLKQIQIEGLRYTQREIVIRELASKVGQPYLKENAKKDYNRLDKLDIFSKINLTPKQIEDGIILTIEVQEIYPYLPFISYEVTDQNGFSIGPGFQSANLLGQDILVSGVARFGGATNFSLLVENPWFAGNHLSYELEINRRERLNDLDNFNEKALELSLELASYIGSYGRIGVLFGFQSIESDTAGKTLSPDNRDNVGSIGIFIGYDSRDLWANPHTGWWNKIDVQKIGGFLDFDSDYWQFNMDLRRYLPVIKGHTIGLFSLSTLSTGTVGEDIAPWQDFSIGGTNSVRGRKLDTRSGKNQFLNTVEYRYTFLPPKVWNFPLGLSFDIGLQAAVFADLGSAWNKSEEFDNNFVGGYGVGLRFLVPFVNQFRFDVGWGNEGNTLEIHIGAFEKPVAQRDRVR